MAARDDSTKLQAYVGAFVVAGCVTMALLIFLWGTPSGMFTGSYSVVAEMEHVGDLAVGAPVRLAGIKVGKVREITLEPDGRDVLVTITVNNDIKLPIDSTASVATAGLVGDQYMEIRLGESATIIPREDEPSPKYRLKGKSAFDLEKLTETVAKATALIDEVKLLVVNVNDVIGGDDFKRNLRNTAHNVDAMTGQATQLLANTGQIMDTMKKAANNVLGVTGRIDVMAEKADKAMDKGLDLVDLVHKTVEETIGSSETAARINQMVDDLGATAANVKALSEQAKSVMAVVTPEKVDGIVSGVDNVVATGRKTMEDVSAKIAAVDTGVVNQTVKNIGNASERLAAILAAVEPEELRGMILTLKGTLRRVSGLADEIMKDPAKALALNKAADRVIDAMFKEMHKQGIRTSEQMRTEVRRRWNEWFGHPLPDPDYPDPEKAPYRRP